MILGTKLLLSLYTILILIGILSLALLCHNISLFSFSTLLPNSFSTLTMLLVAWLS